MSGRVAVVGLGPGPEALQTPAAVAELAAATDLVGYAPYLARVPERTGQTRHASENREEMARARLALTLAAAGRRVAVVSSGDPGVFAMASTVFEAIEAGDPAWREVAVDVVPGVTAMLAAAARVGAPLGGDFCAISLSDNLKPWSDVARRLVAAVQAGFALALYNPASSERPWQFRAALALLRANLPPATPVVFATAIGTPDEERLDTVSLGDADPAWADMRTVVLVGTAATRRIERAIAPAWVYTPRAAVP
jgi:precorrin-3B C17-methyltransferase